VTEFDTRFPALFEIAYRTAYRLLGERGQAEDIAVEALARCHQRWSKVEGFAEPWVARVAGNLAIDATRRRRVASGRETEVDGEDVAVLDRMELVRQLRRLPTRQREVVVLRYLADLPEREVGELLGVSAGAVKQHASRGLERLRRDLRASGAFVG
jgi:RNA polymerase sigma factor (sigma-70 family)